LTVLLQPPAAEQPEDKGGEASLLLREGLRRPWRLLSRCSSPSSSSNMHKGPRRGSYSPSQRRSRGPFEATDFFSSLQQQRDERPKEGRLLSFSEKV
jgi:hypothetical protein